MSSGVWKKASSFSSVSGYFSRKLSLQAVRNTRLMLAERIYFNVFILLLFTDLEIQVNTKCEGTLQRVGFAA